MIKVFSITDISSCDETQGINRKSDYSIEHGLVIHSQCMRMVGMFHSKQAEK